jgi:hypothetical protein
MAFHNLGEEVRIFILFDPALLGTVCPLVPRMLAWNGQGQWPEGAVVIGTL